MNLADVIRAAGTLREARDGDGLEDPCVADCLTRLFPADQITLNELDWRHNRARLIGLAPACNAQGEEVYGDDEHAQFWEYFWPTISCSYTERIPRLRHQVTITEDFYSARQWHSTGLYTDYLGPDGIDTSLIIPLPGPPGIARRLVFSRGPGPSFTGQHRPAPLRGRAAPAAHQRRAAPARPPRRHPVPHGTATTTPAAGRRGPR